MSWLASLVLWVVHLVYSLVTSVHALRISFAKSIPEPLSAHRRRVPEHLALLLVVDDEAVNTKSIACCLKSVRNAAAWAKAAGVRRLTVYDRQSIITKEFRDIQRTLDLGNSSAHLAGDTDSSDSDYEYPLTPPLSDEGDSTPLPGTGDDLTNQHFGVVTLHFPEVQKKRPSSVKRRRAKSTKEASNERSFVLHLLSPASSKVAITAMARSVLRGVKETKGQIGTSSKTVNLSTGDINCVLEGPHGFPSPDLMVVHYVSKPKQNPLPLELHGFPPWQIRLTEISHDPHRPASWNWSGFNPFKSRDLSTASELNELDFRMALDDYALAEMRFGK
ncbi:hypothetical protein NEOLEDRAFT_1144159 [Neolentinus lepideus HHB14362 ss-1]|uniref:ditrans,polycis-polyprenyl diphosphate synthase [(2E,6E)-farnesyldiphosphate specific] n=1 Tax=Neolentinus lepideus HHB14362 ss-1 TaxID=1314782 RepID=A0A165W1P8_9AGAM|nr:hypothetical protein NEOLEDRAFT_1144159 [Neolentinus lepideus HHB14362 ss-1]